MQLVAFYEPKKTEPKVFAVDDEVDLSASADASGFDRYAVVQEGLEQEAAEWYQRQSDGSIMIRRLEELRETYPYWRSRPSQPAPHYGANRCLLLPDEYFNPA